MYRHGDPDASLPTVVVFALITLTFAGLTATLYRPLFTRRAELVHSGG